MRLLFIGSGEFGISSLKYVHYQHELLRVLTQPDRPRGRGRHLAPTPIKEMALHLGADVQTVENINDPAVVEDLLALSPDAAIVVAFGQKIGPEICNGIRGGCVNAHASLLPKYRGAAPIHWAIINGETTTGVTTFKLVSKMDAGPILSQRWTKIKAYETTEELHERLGGIAVDALSGALALYAEDPNPPGDVQDESQASPAPKLKKEQGLIDFGKPARQIANQVCGLWSWPGARCRYVSATQGLSLDVTLARARPAEGQMAAEPPGHIDPRMYVATADGMLEILEIKPAGSKLMLWSEFVNGRHVQPQDRFESIAAD